MCFIGEFGYLDTFRLPPPNSGIFVTLPCWFILNKLTFRGETEMIAKFHTSLATFWT